MRSNEDVVLAACLPRLDVDGTLTSQLDHVLSQNIEETYFQGPHQSLFQCAVAANILNMPLDEEVLRAMLGERSLSPDEALAVQILYKDLAPMQVTRAKVTVIIPALREAVHAQRMADTMETTAKILIEGARVDREHLEGYRPARQYLLSQIAALDSRETGLLPIKDIRDTSDELVAEYALAKLPQKNGVCTGFRHVDKLTQGVQDGELWIWCGYTSEGKTMALLNTAYNAVVDSQKHVAFVSLEMPLAQVRRRLIARHSNHGKFGLPGGLDYTKIKNGLLTAAEERLYYEIVKDWGTSPDYGAATVLQLSRNDTVAALTEKLMYLRSRRPIDLVVLDYASLMQASRRRGERRDEIVEVIEQLKALALSFNQGETLRIVTANQISRKARDEANEHQRYGLSFASDTSAIEKNADLLGWILRTDVMKANREVAMGIAKYRDGDVGEEFRMAEWYNSSLLSDVGP